MRIFGMLVAAATAALAGCASMDGSSLVPNKSTAAEVEALMGAPAERLERADGSRVLYYPRARQTYAVVLGKDGLVRAVEERVTRANIAKLVAGQTATKEVRELFGPPERAVRMERLQRDVWEYPYRYYDEYRVLWVQFSGDGLVREVLDMLDWSAYPPSGPSLP